MSESKVAIPDAAVEAAARAWCGTVDLRDWQRRHITKLLEAAAPHMMAEAWAEGHGVGRTDEWSLEANPYRAAT